MNNNIEAVKSASLFHHVKLSNADGTPQRWRRNGRVKTWKRQPYRFQIPIKRGLWEYGYITERNKDQFVPVLLEMK